MPVERRFFGLDRRSLLPGLVVIALFVLWTVVVPSVNNLLNYSQQTKAGDVFVLGKGLRWTRRRAGAWTPDCWRPTRRTAGAGGPVVLTNGGVSFVVTPGPFRGNADELLDQIKKVDTRWRATRRSTSPEDTQRFHTNDGHRGVAQAYTTVEGARVVALVYGDSGVKITFTGPTATLEDQGDEVEKMIDSIRYDPRAGR